MAQDDVVKNSSFATQDEVCEFTVSISNVTSSADEHCQEPAIFRCTKCQKLYCIDHASEVDPNRFCTECLSPADVVLQELPLKDEDGITHQGRMLKPIGKAFSNLGKLICEMTDVELTAFVVDYTAKLRDAEMSKEFIKINLGLATYEAMERKLIKQKPTGEVYFPIKKQEPFLVKKKKTPSEDKLAEALRKAGVTPEMLAALIAKKKAEKVS